MAARVAGCLLILSAFGMRPPLAAESPQADASQIFRGFRFVATQANGEPVTDLKPEEIQLTDSGKRYSLAMANLLPSGSPTAPSGLGPREYSNRSEDQLASSTLILLDLLNANITERGSAWNETANALEKLEHPENVFLFLMAPDTSLFAVHAWQAPGAQGEAPGAAAQDDGAGPWTRQVHQLLDKALRQVERVKPTDLTAGPGLTAQPTYRALEILASQYAALPGQKRLIWVTHGMPLTVVGPNGTVYMDFNALLKQTAADFSRLGIAIYTVHQLDRSTSGVDSQETLQGLPPLTGGRWFENDAVAQALTQAQADARGTYEAGYYTPAKEADGKFHKLRVSTTRKGVKVLAEEGYAAVAPNEIAQNNLQLVASRLLDTPDIRLRAAFDPVNPKRVQIRIDPRDLVLQHQGDTYTGAVSLRFFDVNVNGSADAPQPIVNKLTLTQDQLNAAIKDGYLVNADWTVLSGTTRVRLVVQDAASGIAGSLTIPVTKSP